MPFPVLLEPAGCASVNVPLLQAGERASLVLEQVQIESEVGAVGLPGKDIGGLTGSLHATTQRLIWLEDGAYNVSCKRSCSIPLAAIADVALSSRNVVRLTPAFKIKLRTTRDGRVNADGRELVKLSITHSNVMAAFSTVNPVKSFVDQLSAQVRRQGAAGTASGSSAAPDRAVLRDLEIMGFEQQRATYALLACDNNLQRAVQWLVEHQEVATRILREQVGAASQSQPDAASSTGMPAPPHLARALQDMGYSAQAAAAAYHSTASAEVAPNVNWLLSNPPAGPLLAAGSAVGQQSGGSYPDIDFTASRQAAAAIQSHPVPEANFYGSHAPGVDSRDSANNPLLDRQAGGGAEQPAAAAGAHRPVGMADLIHGRKAEAQQLSRAVHSGFQDLETLRASGEKLAALAAELRDRMSSRAAKPVGAPGSPRLDTALADSLVDLGIVNPVTKQSAGTQYQEQLARQLAQFLVPVLQKERGMLDMHDVYCLFNRARGLELVSPDDLRSAVEQFARLRLPVQFRQFPSGVAVVQDESWSDDAACERIVTLLDELDAPRGHDNGDASPTADATGPVGSGPQRSHPFGAGLRPMQFAVKAGMPVAVAKEQLLLAERAGVLCRDDAPGGLTFYRNLFLSFAV